MLQLLQAAVEGEGRSLPQEALSAIIDISAGSPRNALVALQQVLQLDNPTKEEVAQVLGGETEDPNAIKLCFAVADKSPKWGKIVEVYNEVKHLGAPALGPTLAGYFRNQLLKAPNPSEAVMRGKCLELFLQRFDEGKSGENQLVLALFKAFLVRSSDTFSPSRKELLG
jgi:DNA polymerase III delta prime subunit